MKNKHYECNSCEAVFRISHDLDTEYYTINNCPFCGETLGDEDNYDIDNEYIDLEL